MIKIILKTVRCVLKFKVTMISLISYLIVITIISCGYNTEKTQTERFKLTKEFLNSEWIIDSLYGSDTYIKDRVYFTPDGQFWRCSYYTKSYLVDSSLAFLNDKVFKQNKIIYSITALDSNNITLKSFHDEIFHLKRQDDFDIRDITKFVQSNLIKEKLNGDWELDSSELYPAIIPSFCNELFKGSRFNFKHKGILNIYPKNSTEKCGFYKYKIHKNEIVITEYDMNISLHIDSISDKKMVIKSKYADKSVPWSDKAFQVKKTGYSLYFSKK